MTGYVVMAVFRPNPGHLAEQVMSLRAQTLTDWRCLVGIDGADPDAVRAVRSACEGDPRFTIIEHQINVGHYRQFERLLGDVPRRAEWVALCDQDDVWCADKLERLTPLLAAASLAQGEAMAVSQHGSRRSSRRTHLGLSALLTDNQVTGGFSVLSPDVLELALPFPAPTAAAYHDHWLGVCAHVLRGIATCHAVVQTYRQHDGNVIGEPVAGRLTSRMRRLVGATGSVKPSALLDEIRRERFGWRVRVARTVLARSEPRDRDRAALEAYAGGTLTWRLVRLVTGDVLARRVPPARALALLVAAPRRKGQGEW
ncbi:glycosyltransferase [Cellulomonas fimi]|uniref:Glycosyl transferase family 2 n=1 Tax=Cellulomonas fimi (strain ATCC 484 / DSM 20113 / JCM 1341 / CCUG 24087 / LMG 16345 / NBRC 15513 / NCIMB 8980 / NCTC 7547 / NRS-133) TaxID=590998 RepID=F4GZE5_CELFA|nr:glycosyltransferase [Cellulomonas fimi]AEE44866.1 glycosyl transferase family 2 [Cellulomonas fimi ATCC 484]NNH08101.1 glycosyltransferase [Cellulomonas fimi]VEH27525.1 Glycosyl transferase family 2 [Cellulomonas fimi]